MALASPDAVALGAHPLTGAEGDYDPLLERIGEAGCVLLGEASHGSAEFYAERARITRRLIEERGFAAVAVEADWPDAFRAGCWARGAGEDPDADAALGDFTRFPRWMWRNREVVRFLEWLREHNRPAGDGRGVGFYGLDLYSLHRSIEKVLQYLDEVDPEAAARARDRYGCFDPYSQSVQEYGRAAAFGAGETCEGEVVAQLVELQRRAGELAARDGHLAEDAHFFAEQNARLVRNAERYYRSMFRGRSESWNLRDTHMAEALDALRRHLGGKVVVWAHNSHVGDARATELGRRDGQLTLGQLAREAYADDAVLVGFTTHSGTVTAASDWDGPARVERVLPGREGSYEALLHAAGIERFLLFTDADRTAEALRPARLHRAIGVIYRPQTELASHYFSADVARQYDALIHLDVTSAVTPLEPDSGWSGDEPPETFPSGM